jgi:hypothetical protein
MESELQSANGNCPRNPSDAGRQIDCNEEQPESARASIRVSFEPDSNVNDASDVHPKKDSSPRNSSEAGRQIDFNDEQ